ncbi:hypothetical protein NC651_033409 [Populus alba x Populus x berolinensis]|nr:hypothetical protein NC651_033409 [Populus alba x Populus x berolinensis]
MAEHSSQWVWFRKLFVSFSSYTSVNEYVEKNVTDHALTTLLTCLILQVFGYTANMLDPTGGERKEGREKPVAGTPPRLLAIDAPNHHDGGGVAHLTQPQKAVLGGFGTLHTPLERCEQCLHASTTS